jgi:hypothetical protein
VIFDGDNDIWAYAFMKGWKANPHCDFDFRDAHDIRPLTGRALDVNYIKSRLRERFRNAKQVIVLIGESTRHLYRFVRWEIEVALDLGLPILAVNLNGSRTLDPSLCPPILQGKCVLHVPFRMSAVKTALDVFPDYFRNQARGRGATDLSLAPEVYTSLGI